MKSGRWQRWWILELFSFSTICWSISHQFSTIFDCYSLTNVRWNRSNDLPDELKLNWSFRDWRYVKVVLLWESRIDGFTIFRDENAVRKMDVAFTGRLCEIVQERFTGVWATGVWAKSTGFLHQIRGCQSEVCTKWGQDRFLQLEKS